MDAQDEWALPRDCDIEIDLAAADRNELHNVTPCYDDRKIEGLQHMGDLN
jgi:hypothetical protein